MIKFQGIFLAEIVAAGGPALDQGHSTGGTHAMVLILKLPQFLLTKEEWKSSSISSGLMFRL